MKDEFYSWYDGKLIVWEFYLKKKFDMIWWIFFRACNLLIFSFSSLSWRFPIWIEEKRRTTKTFFIHRNFEKIIFAAGIFRDYEQLILNFSSRKIDSISISICEKYRCHYNPFVFKYLFVIISKLYYWFLFMLIELFWDGKYAI